MRGYAFEKAAASTRKTHEGKGLLVELFSMYNGRELTGETPLMPCRRAEGWMEGMVQGTGNPMPPEECECQGGKKVEGRRWRGAGVKLVPEEFALHSRRIRGGTRLATKRAPQAVITVRDSG